MARIISGCCKVAPTAVCISRERERSSKDFKVSDKKDISSLYVHVITFTKKIILHSYTVYTMMKIEALSSITLSAEKME